MNKNRKPLDASVRKKVNKNVYTAQSAFAKKAPPLLSNQLTPNDMLKRYPPKLRLADKRLLDSELKRIKIRKKVDTVSYHTHSKRTTPGEVEGRDAAPAIVHKESARWNKNLKLQSVARNKSLTKKLSKKR